MKKQASSETCSIKSELSTSIATELQTTQSISEQSQMPSVQWSTLKSINHLCLNEIVLVEDKTIGRVHFLIENYTTILLEGSTYPLVLTENQHDLRKIKVLNIGDRRCCFPV